MQSFIELSDVGKVRVASPDQRPPEQLEGGLVRVEELSPVVVINFVNIHNHQGEADVDNNEDEEEDEDVNDHVGHGDDNRPGLSPHQTSLNNFSGEFHGSFAASAHLNIPEESHESTNSPETGSDKGGLVALVRTSCPALVLGEGEVAEDEGGEEDQVVGEDVDVLEGEPPADSFLSVLGTSPALLVEPVYCPAGVISNGEVTLSPWQECLIWTAMVYLQSTVTQQQPIIDTSGLRWAKKSTPEGKTLFVA